jgi:hypothetical protein
MPYTKLTSYQFERGTGFTEESVLAFRVLALTAVDELMRSGQATTATFPLSVDELHLILEHRVSVRSLVPPAVAQEALAEPTPELAQEVPGVLEADSQEAVNTRAESLPTRLIPAAAAAHIASDATHAPPRDDDFAAAARWLALATRDDTEPYRPTFGSRHSS